MKSFVAVVSRLPGITANIIQAIKLICNIIPIILVSSLLVWSYYTFVNRYIFMLALNQDKSHGSILLFAYHLILTLFCWSYYSCFLIRAPVLQAESADRKVESPSDLEANDDTSSDEEFFPAPPASTGKRRFCATCKMFKPERTSHCSWCGRCVRKMDHHCPWVGNCIGAHNYKIFVLMLFYAIVYCAFICICLVATRRTYFYPLIMVAFAVSIGTGCLLVFHIYLLATNRTTLECSVSMARCHRCRIPPNSYDKGIKENFCSVFGRDFRTWLLPVQPALSG
eukprot:TRINITY_DN5789_c0_g1_i1.p1 TRINITY_DN5789_c0_g1~~TRINITY_DN5789_c0_g1_i1.p1  ORF type:complete len:282 (+),score=-21.55 TRINITY_DN5789_c0_g1_i1:101-946(+)